MTTAVLLPGSASTSDFVRRAFPQILHDIGVTDWTPTGGDALDMAHQLGRYVSTLPNSSLLIIGLSVGAHAAALWASDNPRPHTRMLLAMPAWTGPPGPVAATTAVAAQRIEDIGLREELAQLTEQYADDWVTAELVRAWSETNPAQLVATLRATARSAAPTVDQLRGITCPTLVLGLHDDPMHPWAVARQWAENIAGAELIGLDRSEPQTDLTAFGRACVATEWNRSGSGEQTGSWSP